MVLGTNPVFYLFILSSLHALHNLATHWLACFASKTAGLRHRLIALRNGIGNAIDWPIDYRSFARAYDVIIIDRQAMRLFPKNTIYIEQHTIHVPGTRQS